MQSAAKINFDSHAKECEDAIIIHDYLRHHSRYAAEFSLRFVWVAAVSALDHYISQLIIERATFDFANNVSLQKKLMNEVLSFSNAIDFRKADPVSSVLLFRSLVADAVRYKTFQQPEKIADGLAYIWDEKHKWDFISQKLDIKTITAKRKLEGIVERRNLICHNADYDEANERRVSVTSSDAKEVVGYIRRLVSVIDSTIVSMNNSS